MVAEPVRPLPGEAGSDPVDALASPLVEQLRAVYVTRVEAFQREFCADIGLSLPAGGRLPQSAYKVVPFTTDDDETDQILVDEDLFATLLFVYVTEGWPAIERIRQFVGDQVHRYAVYGQESDLPWQSVSSFLGFVLSMLAVLIRDALIEIEGLAATAIAGRLVISGAELDKTFRRYDVHPGRGSGYDVGSTRQLEVLASALGEVVAVRAEYQKAMAALRDVREKADAVERIQMGQSRPDNVPTAEQAKAPTVAPGKAGDEARARYEQARDWLLTNEPLALVALDGLTEPVTYRRATEGFIDPWWTVHQKIADISAAVKEQRSRVAETLPGLPQPEQAASPRAVVTPIDRTSLERLTVARGGPELAVVNAALDGLSGDDGLLSLLHEQTWRLLAAGGDVAVDSLTYIVMHHYLRTLAGRQAELERDRATNAEYFRTFGRIAAAVSAALVVTPLGEVAPAVAGLSALADAALVAYTVDGVVRQLRELDALAASRLVAPDALGIPGLAEVGALMVARQEYAVEMTSTLMVELLALAAGAGWPVVHEALVARGFCQDLVTVFGLDEEGGP